jgi:hypothetical protein
MAVGADRRVVACASHAVQAAGSLLLVLSAGQSIPLLLLLGVVLFGSGIGNTTSLPPMIAQVEFVRDDVQRVVSLIVAFGQATYAFATRRVRRAALRPARDARPAGGRRHADVRRRGDRPAHGHRVLSRGTTMTALVS